MAPKLFWLAHEGAGIEVVASAARTASGDSGDLTLATLLGDGNVVGVALALAVDITVQGGTQASVDFDLQFKINAKYGRIARRNVAPAAGVFAFILPDAADDEFKEIGFVTDVYRLAWTFNTPGGTPTITFSAHAAGWGYRNTRLAYPGVRS